MSNPTAILLIPCLLIGGTEVATLETALALTSLGYKVQVLVYFDEVDPSMLRSFDAVGIDVKCFSLKRHRAYLSSIGLLFCLLNNLFMRRSDLVWIQYMTPTILPLLVARLFTKRLIAAVHMAAGHYGPSGLKRLKLIARWWCDRLVCVSNTTAKGIFGETLEANLHAKRIFVLPNTIDFASIELSPRHDWRKELNLTPDVKLIGYVGRLADNKGVDILLRAASITNVIFPGAHFIIIGDGAGLENLKALVEELDLAPVVHFAGAYPRESVHTAIKGLDLAVVPSREEGFGLSALEIMAANVPLIASDVDALGEIVVNGETGLLFEPGSAEDLARCILNLLMDPILSKKIAYAGSVWSEREYGRGVFRLRLSNLINGIFQGLK